MKNPIFLLIVISLLLLLSCKKDKSAISKSNNTTNNTDSTHIDIRDTLLGQYVGTTTYQRTIITSSYYNGDWVDSYATTTNVINDTFTISKTTNDSFNIASKIYNVSFLDTTKFTDAFKLIVPILYVYYGSVPGSASFIIDSVNKTIFHVHYNYGMPVINYPPANGYTYDYKSSITFYKK